MPTSADHDRADHDDPVVIVGMALEAPGGVDSADGYWALLADQREALGPFPTDRGWSLRELLDGSRREGFKRIHDLGGFLSGAACFDPEFFGISPREAVAMDPQQRVALRLVWRALENSGINPDDLAGHDAGCYIGASALEYGPPLSEFSHHSGHLITGTSLGVISGRIAYTLDLAGPAMTIDTSCSSALAAFHTAVQALNSGDCDLAVSGGVAVMGTPGYFVEFSKQHALSDDGHCRPYSAHASGTVWAEGAAMFVLQRRSRALADGRAVLAEVRASCVNSDGRTVGLTAPSESAQARLFRRALARAGVHPDEVGMLEGHGTGTKLGDRTELRSLMQTYGATAPGRGPLLGSVKSNIGHAQAAAGALGLAKVLVAADHAAVPPTLHAEDPSREIDWDEQGLRLAEKLTPWPALDGRRIGAVSAFGMSGTNTHVIVSMPASSSLPGPRAA
jgi:mycobactin polyketide synthetase MbtC